ncbi:hypothetical protein GOBAR_DD16253 [Gossypium barbadense]|nr:hypothetical protein GOBAR_DD16253 [Gossypium barbadense]
MDSLCDSNGEGDNLPGNPSTKKVCFKYLESNPDVEMVVDLTLAPTLSWKDLVLGKGPIKSKGVSEVGFTNGKFSLLEGIPAIEFSDRVHKLLVKDMSTSVVLKLFGRNIGFAALQNKVYELWRPSQPFQLMDIENGYFLAKFQNSDDYEMVLSQVSWLIFKQYLTVQPWTIDFNPAHPYPSTVLARIRFPRLSSYLYKKEVLWKFGRMIGKCIEYESLPVVCFLCGRYGHSKEVCLHGLIAVGSPRKTVPMTGTCHSVTGTTTETGEIGPWMLVERMTRRNPYEDRKFGKFESGEKFSRLRFHALITYNYK